MGNAVNAAKLKADEADEELQSLLEILRNKEREFISSVQLTRGDGSNVNKEVQGGRTASRISEIRVNTANGADPGIGLAIKDFFKAAQGGDTAKQAAVDGAENLLSVGLNALFGAGSGVGREKRGFVTLFLNFAFVRIDFYVYSYSVSGASWGAVANRSGSCYVADIAILQFDDLKPAEIDYILAQSLTAGDITEFTAIQKIKIQLVQSGILTRLLKNQEIDFAELTQITKQFTISQKKISDIFKTLKDVTPALLDTGMINELKPNEPSSGSTASLPPGGRTASLPPGGDGAANPNGNKPNESS